VGGASRGAWRESWAETFSPARLKTRPYGPFPARRQGFEESLHDFCKTIESSCADPLASFARSVHGTRPRALRRSGSLRSRMPMIGVVGEIASGTFPMRTDSPPGVSARSGGAHSRVGGLRNADHAQAAPVGKSLSLEMLGQKIRSHVQMSDEHARWPRSTSFTVTKSLTCRVLDPRNHALERRAGEMVLSVGKAIYPPSTAPTDIDISPSPAERHRTESICPKIPRTTAEFPSVISISTARSPTSTAISAFTWNSLVHEGNPTVLPRLLACSRCRQRRPSGRHLVWLIARGCPPLRIFIKCLL
jgi:hypothetical protein